jgi:hypothetical protein
MHAYLGTSIYFTVTRKVKFTMCDYIKGTLDTINDGMDRESETSAGNHLFEVQPDSSKMALDKDTSDLAHQNVAILLLYKRVHPSIQTDVAFFCAHVKSLSFNGYKSMHE